MIVKSTKPHFNKWSEIVDFNLSRSICWIATHVGQHRLIIISATLVSKRGFSLHFYLIAKIYLIKCVYARPKNIPIL